MKPSKALTAALSVLLALFLLTASVAVPILARPFYYAQIQSLDLPGRTGYSEQTIRTSFDEVMDYLVLDKPFGTGELKWSESGKAHFADCKILFRLDFLLLGFTAALLVLALALRKRLPPAPILGQGPCFWALAALAIALSLLTLWALADFSSLFTAFHTVLFPGKTNWVFDGRTDEIIRILPEEFWSRAAALAAGIAFGGGAVLAGLEKFLQRRQQKENRG